MKRENKINQGLDRIESQKNSDGVYHGLCELNIIKVESLFTFYLFCIIYSEVRYYLRRLLRFSVKIDNVGLADFRPNVPKSKWKWHKCHKHHHSMEMFSSYDLISKCLKIHCSILMHHPKS